MTTQILQNYIAGEWIAGATLSKDINPSDTADVIFEYAQADRAQTELAVEAARAAAPAWAAFGTQARADLRERIG
ncbi:MAG: aldehyde dehydrogenase family protein, partial [Burkholderiales bacterium]